MREFLAELEPIGAGRHTVRKTRFEPVVADDPQPVRKGSHEGPESVHRR
jgi:hypothetical protein